MERAKWVLDRCGMAVLCVNMVYWTLGAEKSMMDRGVKGITEY